MTARRYDYRPSRLYPYQQHSEQSRFTVKNDMLGFTGPKSRTHTLLVAKYRQKEMEYYTILRQHGMSEREAARNALYISTALRHQEILEMLSASLRPYQSGLRKVEDAA